MKLFKWCKDGGPESTVSGLFFVEIKPLFTAVLLKFENGSRDAYHSHAFNAVSWLLKGKLLELFPYHPQAERWIKYSPSWRPIWTPRERFHKVISKDVSWVISFRGPWVNTWHEYISGVGFKTLTHGRIEV